MFEEIIEKARNEHHLCECCESVQSTYLYVIEKSIVTSYFHICYECSINPVNTDVDYNFRLLIKYTDMV